MAHGHHYDVQAEVERELQFFIKVYIIGIVNRDKSDDEIGKRENEDQNQETRHSSDDLTDDRSC